MQKYSEITYQGIESNTEYEETIEMVLKKCFEVEGLENNNLYISIILTNPETIKEYNSSYRNIDKETDVLSFPMYEKAEIEKLRNTEFKWKEALGDIIISIDRVKKQAIEYGHSFEREFAYMLVHGFYHLMGEDHIQEEDKKVMRQKEENVLQLLNIGR